MLNKKTTAPLLDNLIQKASGTTDTPDNTTIKHVIMLVEKIKRLNICGDDERRELWLWAERGAIEDFGNYEEYLEYGEVESREEFHDLWQAYYPNAVK